MIMSMQTNSVCPLRAKIRSGSVDNGATAEGATCKHDHTQVFRRQCAALQKKFVLFPCSRPDKVSLIVITTLLKPNHTLASLSKFTGNDYASRAGADNHHISL